MNLAQHQAQNDQMKLWPSGCDDEKFWRAVLEKDGKFDGTFVFAVRSTRIYCKPSCPSRRPRRDRVDFFPLPEVAEEAGFRPCLRCRPRDTVSSDPRIELVKRVCRAIENDYDNAVTLACLSKRLGMSPFHIQKSFKAIMGITPRQYAQGRRTSKFKAGVRQGQSITNAMYNAGYSSSSRLYERATSELGMTPATYGRGGSGAFISYTIAESPLGGLLVAATEKGICAIRLGNSEVDLEASLRKEYPAAQIHRNDGPMRGWLREVLDHLAGRQPHLALPLDIQATAFQRRVWESLRLIPYGSTRSYSEVAKAIGSPTAARAVARACATNPVALAIPCHRVIREDGSLGGYRWGLGRKKRLLEQEGSTDRIGTSASNKGG